MPDEIPTCPKCGCPESPREQWCLECKESAPGKRQWMADFIDLRAEMNAEWELMSNYVVEKFIRSLLEEVFEECEKMFLSKPTYDAKDQPLNTQQLYDFAQRVGYFDGYNAKREEIKEIKNKYL
jgi:hypothetical protein